MDIWNRIGRLVLAALLLLGAVERAEAAGKRALVIGIDTYDQLGADRQLVRAGSDAKAVAATLRTLGFEVIEQTNGTRRELNARFQELVNQVGSGDTIVIYFAGHGVEIDGRNLLLARDVPNVRNGEEEVLKAEAVSVAALLETVRARKPSITVAIIDACRNNPFTRPGTRTLGRTRGLGAERPPEGTFVLYAAGAGEEALDTVDAGDRHPNSLFARHLLPLMRQPGLEIPDLAREVRRQVREAAEGARHNQTPAYYDEVVGRFCLAGCGAPPAASGAVTVAAAAGPGPALPPASRPAPARLPPGEPPIHACDHSAAAPGDHRRVAEGVPYDKLDVPRATQSCEAALTAFPGAARFEFQLGRVYERARRFQDAARLYQAAAIKDDTAAMASLGIMYADGLGVARNNAEGLRLLQKAAAHGSASALHNLGSMHADGRAVTRDVVRAAEFFVDALAAGGTATLVQFKTNIAGYRPEIRRAIVQRLVAGGHYVGPVGQTFTPDVIRAMERLVEGAAHR